MSLTIRLATTADTPALLAIYSHYVTISTATFDVVAPTLAQFAATQALIQSAYPYLVAQTEAGVVGYAYAHQFSARPAYDWSVEATVYLAPSATGHGLARHLYAALEKELRRQHVLTMTACITADNGASIGFHERLGFRQVGAFPNIANKFGRWLGIVWLAKQLTPLPVEPLPLLAYPQLPAMARQVLRT